MQAWLTHLYLKSLDLLSAPLKAHRGIHQFLQRDVLSNFTDNNLPQTSLFEGGRQTNSRQQDRTALPYEQFSAPVGATGLCCAALRLSAQKQLTFPAAAELSLCPVFL